MDIKIMGEVNRIISPNLFNVTLNNIEVVNVKSTTYLN